MWFKELIPFYLSCCWLDSDVVLAFKIYCLFLIWAMNMQYRWWNARWHQSFVQLILECSLSMGRLTFGACCKGLCMTFWPLRWIVLRLCYCSLCEQWLKKCRKRHECRVLWPVISNVIKICYWLKIYILISDSSVVLMSCRSRIFRVAETGRRDYVFPCNSNRLCWRQEEACNLCWVSALDRPDILCLHVGLIVWKLMNCLFIAVMFWSPRWWLFWWSQWDTQK